MRTYETLLADAARLPVADRIRLIDEIWDTLPSDSLPALSAEWLAEIRRRSNEYDTESASTVSWQQIRAEALSRIGTVAADGTN